MGTVYCFARGMFMRESAIRESHGKGETTTKDQHEIEVLDRSKHGFQNKTLECAKPFVVSFNSTLARVGKGKQNFNFRSNMAPPAPAVWNADRTVDAPDGLAGVPVGALRGGQNAAPVAPLLKPRIKNNGDIVDIDG